MNFEWLLGELKALAMSLGIRLVSAILVFVIGFKVVNVIVKRIKSGKAPKNIDLSAASFIGSFISIALKVVIIVSVIAIMGVPMSSVVALVASAGVAVGLAVQGALSNLVGGIMILLFRPFKVGDYVQTVDAAGTVREITVFYTILTTPDNKVITVPNGGLTNSVVTNYSSEPLRRVDVELFADYKNDTELVKKTLLKVGENCPKTLDDPERMAVILDCGDKGIQYSLRVWCKNEDFWDVKFALIEAIRNAFKDAEIDIPVPQLDVRIKND